MQVEMKRTATTTVGVCCNDPDVTHRLSLRKLVVVAVVVERMCSWLLDIEASESLHADLMLDVEASESFHGW